MMALFARTYGRLDDAVRFARLAVENAPEARLNLNELAMAYGNLGYADQALATMDRAYELAPNNDWVSVVRAGVLLSTGRLPEFVRLADRLLAESSIPEVGPLPQAVRVRLVLAARAEIDRRDYSAAARRLERALGQPPTAILEPAFDVPTLVSLAAVYGKLGQEVDAAQVLDLAESATEGQDDWLSQRLILPDSIAAVQLLRGELDRALTTLVQAEADEATVFSPPERSGIRYEARRRSISSSPGCSPISTECAPAWRPTRRLDSEAVPEADGDDERVEVDDGAECDVVFDVDGPREAERLRQLEASAVEREVAAEVQPELEVDVAVLHQGDDGADVDAGLPVRGQVDAALF